MCFFHSIAQNFLCPGLSAHFPSLLKNNKNKQTKKPKQKTLFFLPLCSSSLPQVEVHKYIPPHGTLSCWTGDLSMANIDMKTSIALSGLSLLSFFSLKLLNSLVFCVFRSPVSKYCFVFVLFYVFILQIFIECLAHGRQFYLYFKLLPSNCKIFERKKMTTTLYSHHKQVGRLTPCLCAYIYIYVCVCVC